MAPNIKETAAVIDSLATLNVNDLVQSKFLPLTQEVGVEEASSEAPASSAVTHKNTVVTPTTDKEQVIADILKDEEIHDMFTINHFQENLVQEAKKDSGENYMPDSSSNDEYWYMPGPTDDEVRAEKEGNQLDSENNNAAKVNGDLYCLWHTKHDEQKRQEFIRTIVEDEKLRETFSVNTIEASLIADAKRRSGSEHVVSAHPETDSYWLWEMGAL